MLKATLEDVRRYNALELDLDKSNYNSSNFIERSNYFEIFIFGLIAGFLALLTPCVFPMIPLTVSYFIDETKLRYSGAISASLYGGFIVLIYILLSIPFHVFDSLNPNILNTISTNVYVNLTFFVVFILFAISFFLIIKSPFNFVILWVFDKISLPESELNIFITSL